MRGHFCCSDMADSDSEFSGGYESDDSTLDCPDEDDNLEPEEIEPEAPTKKPAKIKSAPKPETEFQCPHCTKVCKKPWGLKRHIAAIHVKAGIYLSGLVLLSNYCSFFEEFLIHVFVLAGHSLQAEYLKQDFTPVLKDVVKEMLEEPVLGQVGAQRRAVTAKIFKNIEMEVGKSLVVAVTDFATAAIASSNCVFNSQRYEDSLRKISELFSGSSKSDEIIVKLRFSFSACLEEDLASDVIDMVLFRLCHKFADKVQVGFLIQQQQQRSLAGTDKVLPLEGDELVNFQKLVSEIVRSYHRSGSTRYKDQWLKERLLCLREKFVIFDAELTIKDFNDETKWHGENCIEISPTALKFFTLVEAIIRSQQNAPDGSVSIDSVLDVIVKDENQTIMDLWFILTSVSIGLSENQRFAFMYSLVGKFLNNSNKAFTDVLNRELVNAKKVKKVSLRTGLKKDK